jgi:hypothetical protein
MRILVEMIDTLGVQQRTPPLDPVYLVSLAEEKLGEVGTILAGDSGD